MKYDEQLIGLIKINTLLFDRKSGGYKNKALKAETWEKIGLAIGEPVSDCMTRWKSLRDKYVKLYKQIKYKSSGSACRNKPEWEFYRSLSFLSDHLRPSRSSQYRRSSRNSSRSCTPLREASVIAESPHLLQFGDEELCVSTIEEESCDSELFVTPNNNTKNNDICKEINNDLCNEIKEIITTTMTELKEFITKKNEITNRANYSQSLGVLLNNLSSDNKTIAEAKILEYLCKCQLENFKTGDISNVEI